MKPLKNSARRTSKLFESAWKSQFLSGMMRPLMRIVSISAMPAVALAGGVFLRPRGDRCRRYTGLRSVCQEYREAYTGYCSDNEPGAVNGGSCGESVRIPRGGRGRQTVPDAIDEAGAIEGAVEFDHVSVWI